MIRSGDKLGKLRIAIKSIVLNDNPNVVTQDVPSDFMLIVSEKFTDPTERNGTWVLPKQRHIILDPKDLQKGRPKIGPGAGKPTFKNLYLKFECSVGLRFTLHVSFPEQDEVIRRRNQFSLSDTNGDFNRNTSQIKQMLNTQVDEFVGDPPKCRTFLAKIADLQRSKYLARSEKGIDIVQENVKEMGLNTMEAKRLGLEQKIIYNALHQEEVKTRKEQQDLDGYKKANFMVLRWEFLKAIKKELEHETKEKVAVSFQTFTWVKMIEIYLLLKKVMAKFEQRKHEAALERLRHKKQRYIRKMWRRFLARRDRTTSLGKRMVFGTVRRATIFMGMCQL